MPRQRRVVLAGRPHHITQRGNNRRDVFFEDSDHELYLSLLREYAAKYQVKILGYCLMNNHVHLIAPRLTQQDWPRRSGACITTTHAGLLFADANPGICGRIVSSPVLWRMPIPGRRCLCGAKRSARWNGLRNAKNGLGAVPGSISAGWIGAIGWR